MKNDFFGGYNKKIMKVVFRDFRGILIVMIHIVNANIDGLT